MSDRHLRRLGQDYGSAFMTLLPQGQAWPKHPGTTLDLACRGLAEYWGFVDSRAADLLERESDPRYTLELLPDWERNWGLPDPCYEAPQTIGERQFALIKRMTLLGSQSREFFIEVAAAIGYTITITEYRVWVVGLDRCGDSRVYGDLPPDPMVDEWNRPIKDPRGNNVSDGELSEWPSYGLGPPTNRFYWTVHVDDASLVWFRVTSGQCGVDPHLRIGIFDDLECLLNRWKPAHTQIIFDYSGLSEPVEILLTGTSVLQGAPVGTVVGQFTLNTNAVTGAPVFVLVNDAGGRFTIIGDKLVVAGPLASAGTLQIKVAANDVLPIPGEATFNITVASAAGAGTINLSGPKTIVENTAPNTVIGTLSATGVTGTPVFQLMSCVPEGWLAISGNNLVGLGNINYEASTSIAVVVAATGLTSPPPGLNAPFTITVINVADPT